jgi:hypothetical protein
MEKIVLEKLIENKLEQILELDFHL